MNQRLSNSELFCFEWLVISISCVIAGLLFNVAGLQLTLTAGVIVTVLLFILVGMKQRHKFRFYVVCYYIILLMLVIEHFLSG